ncbi:MAG: hypothetical protein RL011_779 [Pseudomonadota bacterium]
MVSNQIVSFDQLPDGVRLVLPRRELPLSLVRVARSVTVLSAASAVIGLSRLVSADFSTLSPGSVIITLVGAVGIFFGLLLWCGHSVVICRSGQLRLREQCGPFRWQRSFSLTEISQLTVSTLPLTAVGKSASQAMAGESITIMAGEIQGRGRRVLMFGYAPELLKSVLSKLPIAQG